jgi:hypothetical protein
MGDVTAVGMDVITEQSGHSMTPLAVSVCITPAAPSPLPMPYPVTASASEGITDPAMRTKVGGAPVATVGSCLKACHGNEPGTLKEVVSLNTGGPCLLVMGAPVVLCEMGMMGITGSPGFQNKAITVGAGASASDAGGTAGASGSGAVAGTGGGSATGPQAPQGGGGAGSGGSSTAASATPATPTDDEKKLAASSGSSPAHLEAREKVVRHFAHENGFSQDEASTWMGVGGSPPKPNGKIGPSGKPEYGIDLSKSVKVVDHPPPATMDQYVRTPKGYPGNWFDPKGGQSGDDLGLNTDPASRKHTTFNVPPGQALSSTAGPITDDWTNKSSPQYKPGGGSQYTVPSSTKTGSRCTSCGGNPCTC